MSTPNGMAAPPSVPGTPHATDEGAPRVEPVSGEKQQPSLGAAKKVSFPPGSPVAKPFTGADSMDSKLSTRVHIAVQRFKGNRSASMPMQTGSGMASLVGAAMERKRLLDKVKEQLKHEEEQTGERILGDENTGNMERLAERARNRQRKGCSEQYLALRCRVGTVVTHAIVRYTIIALIVIDLLIFMLEINGILDDHQDLLKVAEQTIVIIFCIEVAAKIMAFEKEFFSSWWNIFDFIIVLVSVVVLILQEGLLAVLFARSLKLFSSINRTLRVFRIIIKVYTQGSSLAKRKSSSYAYPIEQVVTILRKVRFSGALSRDERKQIVYLTNALLANTLYIPNLDDITEELARDSQVPDWIASNFNSKPKSTPHSSERHRHIIQRRVRSFTNILTDEGPVVEEVATMLDEQLDTWGFDVFLFNDKTHGWPLFHLFSAIMQWHGLCDEVNCPMSTVTKFIKSIEAQYLSSNSYHSNIHGADVLQSVHVLLTVGGLGGRLSAVQRMSLLVAAAAHDVAHPGLSNNFLVATGDEEALLRNDTSVLEHMHAYRLFKTFREPGCNLYKNVSSGVYKAQRRIMIQVILRTDLAQHFELVGQFKSATLSAVEKDGSDLPDWELMQMTIVLKMADISHPTKTWLLHSRWTQRCMTEFYAQGDREKKLHLPVSPLMDRETTNIPSAQIGFMKVLVAPLFNAWAEAHMRLGWDERTLPSTRSLHASGLSVASPDRVVAQDAMTLLHQVDENLTINVQQWETINSGENKLDWELDVSDESKWTRMCHDIEKKVASLKTPISTFESPQRVFQTLDGAAALQTPKVGGSFNSSRFEAESKASDAADTTRRRGWTKGDAPPTHVAHRSPAPALGSSSSSSRLAGTHRTSSERLRVNVPGQLGDENV